jgi:hypothetical protein
MFSKGSTLREWPLCLSGVRDFPGRYAEGTPIAFYLVCEYSDARGRF